MIYFYVNVRSVLRRKLLNALQRHAKIYALFSEITLAINIFFPSTNSKRYY